MSKNRLLLTNRAFQRTNSPKSGFNLINEPNNFPNVFPIEDLNLRETSAIEKILQAEVENLSCTREKLIEDVQGLSALTAEIKSIGKQGMVLLGERIKKAQMLLRDYRDGAFSRWLELAFGSRKTGYNVLAYYELYNQLPMEEIKIMFRSMSHRAAYVLASRRAPLEAKVELIKKYYNFSSTDFIRVIKRDLPAPILDKRSQKTPNEDKLISSAHKCIKALQSKGEALSSDGREKLLTLLQLLQSVLSQGFQ